MINSVLIYFFLVNEVYGDRIKYNNVLLIKNKKKQLFGCLTCT